MRAQSLLKKFANDEVAFGTAVHSPDPAIIEILAIAGYDWVSIVLEHASLTVDQVASLQRAADARGITTLVHVADAEDARIGPLLDEGVGGIVAPQVTSADDVKAIIERSRFPPHGSRGAAGAVRSADFGGIPYTRYVEEVDREVAIGVVLETPTAVDQIDAILAVDGLTFAFIGLMDLAQAYGVPGQFKNEKVVAAIKRVTAAGREHEIPIGFSEYGYTSSEIYGLGGRMILTPASEYPFFMKSLTAHLLGARSSVDDARPAG